MNPPRFSPLSILSLFAAVFGGMTVVAGGSVLFSPSARATAGEVVPWVVWFNFCSGFAYLAAAGGLWRRRPWGLYLSCLIALSALAASGWLAWHVLTGGAYEPRTLYAMAFRTAVWGLICWAAHRWLKARGETPLTR